MIKKKHRNIVLVMRMKKKTMFLAQAVSPLFPVNARVFMTKIVVLFTEHILRKCTEHMYICTCVQI